MKQQPHDAASADESVADAGGASADETVAPAAGHEASSVVRAWHFLCRLYHQVVDRDLHNHAAEMAYYGMMAVFPFFLLITTVLGHLPIPDLFGEIMRLLADYAPSNVVGLLEGTVREVTSVRDLPLPKLILTMVVCLWWSLGAMGSTTRGLNKAFGLDDPRHYGRFIFLNFGLTLLFSQLLLVAMVLIMLGPVIHEEMMAKISLGSLETWPLVTFRWSIVLCTLFATHAGIYWICPAIKRKFRLFTPGTIFVVITWITASYGLRFYLKYASSYDLVFGSLATVIILLFWFFLMALLLLIGGAIDAITHPEYVRRKDSDGRPIAEPFSWRLVLATFVVVVAIPVAILVSLEPASFTPKAHVIRGDLRTAIETSLGSGTQTLDFQLIDQLFQRHIDPVTGTVDYEGLREDRATIDQWLRNVEKVRIDQLAADHLEALLINLYNVGVWTMVLDGRAGGRAVSDRSDDSLRTFVDLQGQFPVSMGDLKNRMLRPFFHDPRVLFAVHDGSRARPPLLPEAMRGEDLRNQLDRLTQRALTPPWTRVENGRIILPRLFDLYENEFIRDAGSLTAWLDQRLPAEARKILRQHGTSALDFSPADSSLNAR